ncbi:MAG: radical SAM protein [Polyangiaceae bacterium]|nr:radical SAM protein [Polyangiaceae bacterium]
MTLDKRHLDVRVPGHEDEAMAEVMAAPLAVQLERLAAWGLPRAGLLILMSACHGRCFFCASPAVTAPGEDIVTPVQRIERWLDDNRRLGVEALCIGGTEPPTHAHFRATLERAQQVGFRRVQLMTSGLSIEDDATARQWFRLGVRSVCAPLYGSHAALHDQVVGVPGHFERATRGLDRARASGMTTYVHTLALRRTLGDLSALGRLTRERWGATLAVAPLRAKDDVFSFEREAASYGELEAALEGADVSLIGMPRCIAPALPRGAALLIQLYFRAQRMTFDATCTDCAERARCPGLVAAHHARYGADGLRPALG